MHLKRAILSNLHSDTIEDPDCSLDAPMRLLAVVHELSQGTGKLSVFRLTRDVYRNGEETGLD